MYKWRGCVTIDHVTMMLRRSVTSRKSRHINSGPRFRMKNVRQQMLLANIFITRHLIKLFDLIEFLLLFRLQM